MSPAPSDSTHTTESPIDCATTAAAISPARYSVPFNNINNAPTTHPTQPSPFAFIYRDLEVAVGSLGLTLSLPSLARKCVDHFFDCLYPIMPIVYRPKVELGLCLLQPGIERREVDIQVFTLTASVCAIAAAIIPSSIFSEGSLIADKFYHASKRGLDLCHATELEQAISASIAIRYFQSGYTHSVGKPRTSWDELEAAISLAQDMRLHDETSYAHMDEVESQLCRRLFWVLYTGDKSAGILGKHHITLGRYLLEEGITVQYTKSLDGEDSTSTQDSAEPMPTLITGFNFNQDLWRAAYLVLLEIDTLHKRYLGPKTAEDQSSKTPTAAELSHLGRLYVAFETSLGNLPACLRAHPTLSLSPTSFQFGQYNTRISPTRAFALQRINLHVSYQCLRLVIVQAIVALLDFGIHLWHQASPLWPSFLPLGASDYGEIPDSYDPFLQTTHLGSANNNAVPEFHTHGIESSTLLLQKIRIAEDMLYILHASDLDDLRLNGESCVEKIRLVGASMLELIDHHSDSPLVNSARSFGDLYPHILAHLESKASDSLSENV